MGGLRQRAAAMRSGAMAVVLAFRHRRTPWYAKVFGCLLVLYVVSPIDLIPDFIPLVGYLDDLILLSVGMWLLWRMVPDEVRAECCRRAAAFSAPPCHWGGVVLVATLWLLLLAGVGLFVAGVW